MYGNIPSSWQRPPWRTYGYGEDYSYGILGEVNDGIPLQEWSSVGLSDWGYLSPQMGMLGGGDIPVEVGPDQTMFYNGLARTPMIELSPEDYGRLRMTGSPYHGMLGLGDDGETYVYDGLGGFFKRLFRRIKRGVKRIGRGIRRGIKKVVGVVRKVGKRIWKGAKQIIKRLPGGKALIKIAGKIHKVAMKVVRPAMKFVGKWAGKLAPIASFVPGYGPAIAAGLRIAGRVAKGFTAVDRIARGKVPWGAIKSRLPVRIPGLFGEATPESIETQQNLMEVMPRYYQ
ncbi:MAG: hypothetical protein PHD68_02180 [Rugosibacter sp.]|nr:hypothetical protein [Rugosibacter sp.]